MSEHVVFFSNKIEEEMRKPEAERNQQLIDFWKGEIVRLTTSSTPAGKFITKFHSISFFKKRYEK
jgi:hypothetical protein